MANYLEPKKKAKSILDKMERAINETTIGGITLEAKLAAIVAVDELIEEHNYKSPISWNLKQTKYWQAVKSEVVDYKTD
jgi:hypothetical protein